MNKDFYKKGISKITVLLCTVILLGAFFFSSEITTNKLDISQSDALQYQLQAVNLAKYGAYPKLNLYGEISEYGIDTTQKIELSSSVFHSYIFNHPPIDDYTKPPLYPLILAGIYFVFGIDFQNIFLFHLFLISLTAALLPFIAYQLMGRIGILIGVISAWFYFNETKSEAIFFYPHLLVQFFLLLLVYFIDKNEKRNSRATTIIISLLLGLMVLTNGNTVFIPLFYFAYQAWLYWRGKKKVRIYTAYSTFALVLLPWIIFANVRLFSTTSLRVKWKEKLWENVKTEVVSGPVFIDKKHPTKTDTLVMQEWIRDMYSRLGDDGFIVISKQPFGDGILGAHNEFCDDGRFHPEWRFMSNSYYFKHPSTQSLFIRIVDFYLHNPSYILKNIIGKFNGTRNNFSFLYYLSGILFFLYPAFIDKRKSLRWAILVSLIFISFLVPFPALLFLFLIGAGVSFTSTLHSRDSSRVLSFWLFVLLNTIFITLLFIGEARYVKLIDSILFVCTAKLVFDLLELDKYNHIPIRFRDLFAYILNAIKPFRLYEVILMSGYFIIAFVLAQSGNSIQLTLKVITIYTSVVFYIGSVYMLNSFADYTIDKLNPRLQYLSRYSQTTYLLLSIILLGGAILISVCFNYTIASMIGISYILWVLYYCNPFRLKSKLLTGTFIHFISGIIHFQIGFAIVGEVGFISLMISLFFSTLLGMGHLNHELLDLDSDRLSGIKNTAVTIGANNVLRLFYGLFVLSQFYLLLLLKWQFIDMHEFIPFFYLPVILGILVIGKSKILFNPFQIQRLFRMLLLMSALLLIAFKLVAIS